jgi:hypothetical protein
VFQEYFALFQPSDKLFRRAVLCNSKQSASIAQCSAQYYRVDENCQVASLSQQKDGKLFDAFSGGKILIE